MSEIIEYSITIHERIKHAHGISEKLAFQIVVKKVNMNELIATILEKSQIEENEENSTD